MEGFDKVVNFLKDCTPPELVMLATLILIPVLVIILLIVSLVKHSHRKSEESEVFAENEIEQAQMDEPADVAAPTPAAVPYEPQVQKAAPERVKVKVRVTNLEKADKYLLMATGIFCVGLGVMIQRAMSSDK